MNKVVVRFVDGRVLKGMTADFIPAKDLKALFFVKDFVGSPKHIKRNEFDPAHSPAGRKIRVRFIDGEELVGTMTGYQKGRPGFFLVPANADSNTERCYVVAAATREIRFI